MKHTKIMNSQQCALALFWLIALAYILSSVFAPYPFQALFKVTPVLILLGMAYQQIAGVCKSPVLLALFFSGCGDVILAVEFQDNFRFGLAAFLVAHLCYIATLAPFASLQNIRFKLLGIISVLIYSVVMSLWVMPHEPALQVAVVVYITVITLMCATAMLTCRSGHYRHIAGAVIFAISDSFIAWDAFRDPIPCASVWIMTSYYAAQYLLISGVQRLTAKHDHGR